MKKMSKLLCTFLVLIMIASTFAACTSGGSSTAGSNTATESSESAISSTDSTGTTESTSTTDSADTAASGPVDWRTPYPETVKVTIANDEMSWATFAEGETIYDNLWTRAWKDEFNIEVETVWVSGDYETKLNLSIAAGDLPDIFYCTAAQFQQLLEADVLQPLNDVYEANVSPAVRKMMEDDPDIFATAFKGDQQMAMPKMHYGYETYPYVMWLKKNWYEEAGSPPIDTLEQFEDLMRQFKDTHNSPYAMPISRDLEQFYMMAPTWHAYPKEHWVDDGTGNIVYGATLPEMRPMLEKWAEWYKEGLLRSDFASTDFDMEQSDLVTGVVGVLPGEQWYGWTISDTYRNEGEDAWFEAYDLPSVDGKPTIHKVPFPNDTYNVVNKSCKNPEVLIKLMNHYSYVLNEAMVEGADVEKIQPFALNNMHQVPRPFMLQFRSYDDVNEVIAAVNTGVEDFSSGYAYNYYHEVMRWHNDRDANALGRALQMGQTRSSLALGNKCVDEDRLSKSAVWGPPPQELSDYGTTLDDLLKEGYAKIITGIEPIDYLDTLIQNWRTAGGDTVTAAVNAMYGK